MNVVGNNVKTNQLRITKQIRKERFEEMSDKQLELLKKHSDQIKESCMLDKETFFPTIYEVPNSAYVELFNDPTGSDIGTTNITSEQFYKLVGKCCNILEKRPACGRTFSDAIIVGDIHGHPDSIEKILSITETICSNIFNTLHIFNGDFVDRGPHSVPVVIVLMKLLLAFPNNIWLQKGNHEVSQVNTNYGFLKETMLEKYDHFNYGSRFPRLYLLICKLFNRLPLAIVIGNENCRALVVHANINPQISIIDMMKHSTNLKQVDGKFDKLYWNDVDVNDKSISSSNSARGYGQLVSRCEQLMWCDANSISMIIVGHQPVDNGWATYGNATIIHSSNGRKYDINDENSAIIKTGRAFGYFDGINLNIYEFGTSNDDEVVGPHVAMTGQETLDSSINSLKSTIETCLKHMDWEKLNAELMKNRIVARTFSKIFCM
jgi:hypothetical protein